MHTKATKYEDMVYFLHFELQPKGNSVYIYI